MSVAAALRSRSAASPAGVTLMPMLNSGRETSSDSSMRGRQTSSGSSGYCRRISCSGRRLEHFVGHRLHLFGRDVAADAERHIVQVVEGVVAAVKDFRRDLRNRLHRPRDVYAHRVVDVQRPQQVEVDPPRRVVDVHFDLFADDALLLAHRFLGKVRRGHEREQHAQVFVKMLGAGEQIDRARERGERVRVPAERRVKRKRVGAVLVFKHLVL